MKTYSGKIKSLLIRLVTSILCLVHISTSGKCQERINHESPRPSFFAIIVTKLDSSIWWYQKNFSFKLISRYESPNEGFRQANLQNGAARIELIELQKSVIPDTVLANLPTGSRLTGFFKIGFNVNRLDHWQQQLQKTGANLFGSIVKDPNSGQRMLIVRDPDGNRIQLFEKDGN